MNILSIFVERLKELMFDRNIKSEKLGKAIGIGGSTIRRWVRQDSKPNLNALIALAEFFGCSIQFLMGKTEHPLDFTPHETIPFPTRLRQVLHECGMTRYSLDRDTKFKDSYLYSWDHGSVPDFYTIHELADYLNCTVDYLVGRER